MEKNHMINPAKIFKIKSAWDTFTQNHPKFPQFMNAVKNNAIEEGSIIEIKVTTVDGRTLNTNVKLTSSDLELFQEITNIAGN